MIRTLKAFDIKGKNILLRVDFNVPLLDNRVGNNFRIKAALPTIKTCLEGGAAIVLMSHLGRPGGKIDRKLSLIPIGEELASLLEMPIKFSDNCISTDAIDTSLSLKPGEIHLLENLRFHIGEKTNDPEFSRMLSRHGQIYINDAFGTAHRSHASNVGVISYFKHAGIGWLMDKELNFLQRIFKKPNHPLTLVLGGAKIDTKLGMIKHFIDKADNIIIGGGMVFTFLKAMKKNIGGSIIDNNMVSTARDLINLSRIKGVKLYFPSDFICGKSLKNTGVAETYNLNDLPKDLMGLDIGPKSLSKFQNVLSDSKTIFWNGPMGVFELSNYETGTRDLGMHLTNCVANGSKVIVGGGDTAAALEKFNIQSEMTHVSTGGGASLALFSGKLLPAIKKLEE